jgi:hypothetical protein
MNRHTHKSRFTLMAAVISVAFLVTSGKPAFPAVVFSDDFQDGTLGKWNVVLGTWEVISEGTNLVAHLTPGSTQGRRMVSVDAFPGNMLITAKVKGDCDPIDEGADTAVGFCSNSEGSSFYFVVLGRNSELAIYRFDNGVLDELVVNFGITSYNNVWYYLKIQLASSTIYAKRWEVGSSEPSDWQISYAGATQYGNHILLGGIAGQHNEEFWFDDVTVADGAPPEEPDEGLVGYWSFDEGSGDTVHDYSGHGNHGTVYGANWVTGRSGSALEFLDTDIVRFIPNSFDDSISTSFSIASWLYWNGQSSWGGSRIFDGRAAGPWSGFHFSVRTDGRFYLSLYTPEHVSHGFVSTCPVQVAEWTHVAAVFDYAGGTVRLFWNGLD